MNSISDSTRLAELFADLSERAEFERVSTLDSVRVESPELATELESLLAAHDEAGGFLGRLDAGSAVELLKEEESRRMPARAGPWRLIREIGRGGLGVVYLAERDFGDPRSRSGTGPGSRSGAGFKQRAAVKLIKRGMDSDLILRRFRHERRILASLEHPNIARLIDGGALDDGRPYFAMEYVDGTPITAWCDACNASINERLRLFEQVCRAVQYAHARLIVHRDLKPANILVADKEQPATIKLLDFGIAKLLDEEGEGGTTLTIAGMRAMTPKYAAPEQVLGEPVSVATDVYALGVVLYRLLAGHYPYREGTATRERLARTICDTVPTLPSAAVTDDQARTVAEARSSSPRALKRRLRGDLDNVVLMAMAKEPGRRYGSAEALADDIRRHLEGMPVRARRETLAYRTSRFVYQHRIGVAITSLVFALMVGFIAVLAHQQSVTLAERDRAQRAADETAQVSAFLVDMFKSADPAEARGEAVTAHELLERGVERIEAFEGDARTRASLLGTLGEVRGALGAYADAESLYRRALAIHHEVYGPRGAETMETTAALGRVLNQQGRYEESMQLLEVARESVTGLPGRAAALHRISARLASALSSLGRYDEAELLLRENLVLERDLYGARSAETAATINHLGSLLIGTGRYPQAEARFREALAIRSEILGEDHPQTLVSLSELAQTLLLMGNHEESARLYEQVVSTQRRLLGDEHPGLAMTLHRVAMVWWNAGDLERAEAPWREALAINHATVGPMHPETGRVTNGLALIALRRGELNEAERLMEETLAIYRDVYGGESSRVGVILGNLAAVHRERGELATAERLMLESLRMRKNELGDVHPSLVRPLIRLSELYLDAGRRSLARQSAEEALAIGSETLVEDHARMREVMELIEGIDRIPED